MRRKPVKPLDEPFLAAMGEQGRQPGYLGRLLDADWFLTAR
ncbi:MAG TPA: hypothetical protein VGR07_17440 [Thermoanaerobaculia bacterium]|nr:hypothetical protein [Thermoanaerobaculia bacterium]